ncbi:hypothetical protein HEQ69_10925 [Haematospirillum jordaniae]|uniref:hypothetical protein n=1 Tax=Haematospirillum jordaniae TaxID=1549855 RepID=UPI001432DA94|nr:hypothetical protein [Haematospirillum jordaniae]NKD46216.1 hypothetical protein [Haematospirillum jordaniae]
MKTFSEHMTPAQKLAWLDGLLAVPGLPPRAYHVGAVLARGVASLAASASGTAENIAAATGLTARSIMDALRCLRVAGFLGHFMRRSVVRPFVQAGRAALSGATTVIRAVSRSLRRGSAAPVSPLQMRDRLINRLKSVSPGASHVLASTRMAFDKGVLQIRGTPFARSYLEAHMDGGALDCAARSLHIRVQIVRD